MPPLGYLPLNTRFVESPFMPSNYLVKLDGVFHAAPEVTKRIQEAKSVEELYKALDGVERVLDLGETTLFNPISFTRPLPVAPVSWSEDDEPTRYFRD